MPLSQRCRTRWQAASVRHARLVIHRMHLDGVEVPIRFATLVAVARNGLGDGADGPTETADFASAEIDWEVVADGVDEYAGELHRHHVELLCITRVDEDGHLVLGELSGDAVVVRFVERTVVLRGDGPLSGLTTGLFEG